MNYTIASKKLENLSIEDIYNYHTVKESSLFTKFVSWCDAQEKNQFLWLALTFFAQVGLTLPLTALFIVFFGGNNLALWITISVINIPVLVLTLAAFPAKIKLPFVFFSWLVQLIIIIYCIGFAIFQ